MIFLKLIWLANIAFEISFLFIGNEKIYFGKAFFNLLKIFLSFLYNLFTSTSALNTG